jgi:hypothetical protein
MRMRMIMMSLRCLGGGDGGLDGGVVPLVVGGGIQEGGVVGVWGGMGLLLVGVGILGEVVKGRGGGERRMRWFCGVGTVARCLGVPWGLIWYLRGSLGIVSS